MRLSNAVSLPHLFVFKYFLPEENVRELGIFEHFKLLDNYVAV